MAVVAVAAALADERTPQPLAAALVAATLVIAPAAAIVAVAASRAVGPLVPLAAVGALVSIGATGASLSRGTAVGAVGTLLMATAIAAVTVVTDRARPPVAWPGAGLLAGLAAGVVLAREDPLLVSIALAALALPLATVTGVVVDRAAPPRPFG
ncbi:MAG TPA: hypothetical protein VFM93_10455 [Candidatus Limnocylindria bacterium]|nr:hypothetical protein [Candidatus Limnocylindria bacterium]